MSLSTKLVRLLDIKKTNTKVRLHSTAQRKKALRVFECQGILAPIVLDERLNILDGNLRFEIAQELGWKSLNCVILQGLSEVQKKELSLSLSRLSEDSKWDPTQLKLHLEAIAGTHILCRFGVKVLSGMGPVMDLSPRSPLK